LVAGLGGRPITIGSLDKYFKRALIGGVEELEFLDLNQELAESELAKERA
jgi:pyruvate ferredoxin oxidoreductase alpha subunit